MSAKGHKLQSEHKFRRLLFLAGSEPFSRFKIVSGKSVYETLVPRMAKPPIAAIEPPVCPKCGTRMPLVRLAPNGAGSETQTFECTKCGTTKTVEVTHPSDDAGGWIASRDLRPPD